MQFGSKVAGRLQPIEITDLSTPNETYQIDLFVDQVADGETAIQQLLELENQFPDLEILYIDACPLKTCITVQLRDVGPGQFGFETILASMSALLAVLGITLIAVSIWGIIPALAYVPEWVAYTLAIGGFLLVTTWLMGKWNIKFAPDPTVTGFKSAIAQSKMEIKKMERQQRIAQERINRQEDKYDEAMRRLERAVRKQTAAIRKRDLEAAARAETEVQQALANVEVQEGRYLSAIESYDPVKLESVEALTTKRKAEAKKALEMAARRAQIIKEKEEKKKKRRRRR